MNDYISNKTSYTKFILETDRSQCKHRKHTQCFIDEYLNAQYEFKNMKIVEIRDVGDYARMPNSILSELENDLNIGSCLI